MIDKRGKSINITFDNNTMSTNYTYYTKVWLFHQC